MRYVVIVNNNEWIEEDQDMSLENVTYEIGELLASGYISVESVKELDRGYED